jgi:hypothetical protein
MLNRYFGDSLVGIPIMSQRRIMLALPLPLSSARSHIPEVPEKHYNHCERDDPKDDASDGRKIRSIW